MTAPTKEQLSKVFDTAKQMGDVMESFKNLFKEKEEKITQQVEKVEKTPASLEADVLKATQGAIAESVKAVLSGYNSPLHKLVAGIIDSRSGVLKEIITTAFDSVISTAEFKESIVSAFAHKVSRSIISNNDGLFDKVSNELKQDPVFKSKMTLAVAQVVEECLKNK